MVVIRLARIGKKKQAFYRVVAADSRRPVTAKFIEILGWYNPHSKELNIKKELVDGWLKKGAKPSNSLAVILKENGVKLPAWVEITQKSRKPKKTEEKTEPIAKEEKTEAETDKPAEAEPEKEQAQTEEVIKTEGEETPSENN